MVLPSKGLPNHRSNIPPPKTAAQIATSAHPNPAASQGTKNTLFDEWLEKNVSQPSAHVTVDDIVSARVIRTDQPQTTALSLVKAARYDVQEMVRTFEGLSDEVREECYEYIRTAHVFPNFVRNNQLHILDVQHLGAQVASYLVNANRAQSFYAAVEKDKDIAQSMVDLLQALLDLQPQQFDAGYKPCFLGAVIRLTRKTLVYPSCLEIKGVSDYAMTIDEGGSGLIYQGSLLGRTVALKRLKNKGQDRNRLTKFIIQDFAHEAVLWRNVNHANCLPFYGIFKDLQWNNGDLHLVSPWMEQGDLSAYLSENPNVDRLPLIYDIASGLEYLHKMQPTIVHGDLKCLNIFVTNNNRACIADFGFSHARDFRTKVNSSIKIGGTLGFIAPEIYSARSGDELRSLDFRRCDMFAFGSVIYEVYGGDLSKLEQCNVVDGHRPPRPSQELCKMDDDIWQLVESLWKQDPDGRPVAESARGFVCYRLQTRPKRRSLSNEDPEWALEFLKGTGVSTSPFQLL
ncbi:kinase-like domain-containing protein [Scleroderma citrinum]